MTGRAGILAGVLAVFVGILATQAPRIRRLFERLGAGWSNLHPETQARALAVLEEASRAEWDDPRIGGVIVGEGWRTDDRQREVMATGHSEVGSPLRSYHRWGLAVDFWFVDRDGEVYWPNGGAWSPDWDRLGAIIEAAGFEWGGRWSTLRDGPHAQLTRYGNTDQLIAAWQDPAAFLSDADARGVV